MTLVYYFRHLHHDCNNFLLLTGRRKKTSVRTRGTHTHTYTLTIMRYEFIIIFHTSEQILISIAMTLNHGPNKRLNSCIMIYLLMRTAQFNGTYDKSSVYIRGSIVLFVSKFKKKSLIVTPKNYLS